MHLKRAMKDMCDVLPYLGIFFPFWDGGTGWVLVPVIQLALLSLKYGGIFISCGHEVDGVSILCWMKFTTDT